MSLNNNNKNVLYNVHGQYFSDRSQKHLMINV